MTDTPSSKKKGRRGEKQVTEEVLKDTINSGAVWFTKGDKKSKDYLIEVKTTDKKSFRITTKVIEKIVEEAYSIQKEPLICIVFPKYILNVHVRIK